MKSMTYMTPGEKNKRRAKTKKRRPMKFNKKTRESPKGGPEFPPMNPGGGRDMKMKKKGKTKKRGRY